MKPDKNKTGFPFARRAGRRCPRIRLLPVLLVAALAAQGAAAVDFKLFGPKSSPQQSTVLMRDGTQVELANYRQVKSFSLDLRWAEKTSNITALAGLPNLTELNLNLGGTRVSDLGVLRSLKKLTTLTLTSPDGLPDLGVLKDLPELTTLNLDLQGSDLKDLSALKGLTRLTRLKLDLKGAEAKDISFLKEMPNLRELDLTVVVFEMDRERTKFIAAPSPTIRVRYADRTNIAVLGDLRQLSSLKVRLIGTMSGGIDISPLAKLTNLTALKVVMDDAVADFDPLRQLTNLTSLSLNVQVGWQQTNGNRAFAHVVETLNSLPNLKTLDLDLRHTSFFGAFADELKTLRNVTSITANIYTPADLAALTGAKSLTTLNLAVNASGVTTLAPLKDLPRLATLNVDLSQQNDMRNVNWLPELPSLKSLSLNIKPNSRVTDISALAKLKNLERLMLNLNFNTSDLAPLQGLKSLTSLSLDLIDNYRTLDLNALKSLPSLATLHLRLPYTEGKTYDISVLGDLAGLTSLDLDFARTEGKISDSSVLARLTRLQSLSAHGRFTADGGTLAGFKGLTRLDIGESSFRPKTLPESVTDLSLGSYATETNWVIVDLWE